MSKNQEYTHIVDMITFYYSEDPKDIYNFFSKIIEFNEKFKKEGDVKMNITDNIWLNRMKFPGNCATYIHSRDKKAHTSFTDKEYLKLRDEFVKYCDSNNIKYK